jgi:hypothetical protein
MEDEILDEGLVQFLRRHPILTGFWAGCVVLGLLVAVPLLAPKFGMARALFGGVVGGLGSALCLTANRLIG